jgi:beta-N-acetylhexosaminidase
VNRGSTADPGLGRLADAILLPPFPGHAAPDWVLAGLEAGLAGVTLFGPNIASDEQLAALTARLRQAAAEPILAIDEEGGDVTRLAHHSGSRYPGNAALGAVDDIDLTEAVYRALGSDLMALGLNLNLAPSVDVNTAADNPVIGTRSFGSDTSLVARHAAAAVRGLQRAGIAACAKHFPGHGSTRTDTHHAIATVDASLDLLAQRDLPPFRAAIAAGVRAIMPGHLRVPALTGDLPASLSAPALTGLLRRELGFTGVITSDALEMRALSGPFGIPEAAVRAVAGGVDLLCLGRDTDRKTYLAVREALVTAVSDGRTPARRLEEAATRVAMLRSWLANARSEVDSADRPRADRADGLSIGLTAARRALRAYPPTAPTPDGAADRPLVIELVPPANIAAGSVPWGLGAWVPADSVIRLSTGTPAASLAGQAASVLAGAEGRFLVIVVRDAHRHPAAREMVTRLVTGRPDAIVVEMGLPIWRPPVGGYLATYGAARTSSRAAAEVLGLTALPCHRGRAGRHGWHHPGGPVRPRMARAGCIMLDMRLSARADYALRAAVELAAAKGSHVTADQLARTQGIPGKFLEAILTQLRRAGLIRSQRGPDGGFWLARPPSAISLADIIRAIDGPLVGVRGERPENLAYIGAAEPLQTVWVALRANERAILEDVTLEHIVAGPLPDRVRKLADDPRAWA